jgi:membrane-associated phospholipid phosphatase
VVGVLALLATLSFVLLYLPGSPSALVWPQEWLIVLIWAALGAVFAMGIRRRVVAMGGLTGQASLILGEYAEPLGLARSGGPDASHPYGADSEEVKA